jgi:hypothetical protein
VAPLPASGGGRPAVAGGEVTRCQTTKPPFAAGARYSGDNAILAKSEPWRNGVRDDTAPAGGISA